MITPHTLRLESCAGGRQPLYLAPYGAEEVAYIMPLDGTVDHESIGMRDFYRKSPVEQVDETLASANALSWGIYAGAVSTRTFIGSIDLIRGASCSVVPQGLADASPNPLACQEIGTLIAPGQRLRGYGTLAKIALATFAMLHHGTTTLTAQTAMANLPARHSLAKAGFGYVTADLAKEWVCGSMTYHWQMMHPEYIPSDLETYQHENLIAGWQRYRTTMRQYGLTFVELGQEVDDLDQP